MDIHNHNSNSSNMPTTLVIWIVHAAMYESKEKSATIWRTMWNYKKSRKLLKKELSQQIFLLRLSYPMQTPNTARFQDALSVKVCSDWKKKLTRKLSSTERFHMSVIFNANSAHSMLPMLDSCSSFSNIISTW